MPWPITSEDVEAQLPYVDDPDVLAKAEYNPALELALVWFRPVNWWGTGLKPERLLPIAEDGIPVAWVPDPVILKGLVDAQPGERIALLVSHAEEIAGHCRALIDECPMISHTSFSDRKLLLLRALDAFEATYHEAAMALAVNVAEGLAVWISTLNIGGLVSAGKLGKIPLWRTEETVEKIAEIIWSERYKLAKKELNSGILNRGLMVHRHALIAPIPRFFKSFYPHKGDAVPDTLSRHAVAHQPTIEHYSHGNALLAIMLATSLLREYEAHQDPPAPDYEA
jgi:hypothetical protein